MSREWFSDTHKVVAIHPISGELEDAILEEDWFGPRKDAIRFSGFNTPHFSADDIAWEFAEV